MWILPSLARRAHVHYSDTKRCFGLYKTDLEKSVDDEVNSTSEIKGTPKVGGTFRIYNRSSCGGIGLIKDGEFKEHNAEDSTTSNDFGGKQDRKAKDIKQVGEVGKTNGDRDEFSNLRPDEERIRRKLLEAIAAVAKLSAVVDKKLKEWEEEIYQKNRVGKSNETNQVVSNSVTQSRPGKVVDVKLDAKGGNPATILTNATGGGTKNTMITDRYCFMDKQWLGVFDESISVYKMLRDIHRKGHYACVDNQEMLCKNGGYTPTLDCTTRGNEKAGMWWKQLLAGGASAFVSRSFTAPIDRLKVMLQVHSGGKSASTMSGTVKYMVTEGGIKSMWRGNFLNCVKVCPEMSIKLFIFEEQLRLGEETYKKQQDGSISAKKRFAAGAFAGITAQAAIYPMEVVKTKLAIAKTNQYNSIYDCARTVMKTDGIRGFYRGMTPALLGMIPYAGIDLCIYETMKNNWINSYSGERKPNCFVYCLSAFTSASIAQSASYPLGLIRTKLQAHSSSTNAAPVGMVQMFKSIVKQHGYSGLYRGIIPSYLKVLPSVTITYIMYEYMRQALGMSPQQ